MTLTKIIEQFAIRYQCDENITLEQINDGYCCDFAIDVCKEAKRNGISRVRTKQGPGHTWIVYGALHYDAEHPTGVENPCQLSFYKRDLRKARRLKA